MISCNRSQSSHPTGCVVESYNLIYYSKEQLDQYFTWVPYDLSTHTSDTCSEIFAAQKFSNITELLKSSSISLPAQFSLYNIPMIFYVKWVTMVTIMLYFIAIATRVKTLVLYYLMVSQVVSLVTLFHNLDYSTSLVTLQSILNGITQHLKKMLLYVSCDHSGCDCTCIMWSSLQYDEESLISLPFFTPISSAEKLQDHLVDVSHTYICILMFSAV